MTAVKFLFGFPAFSPLVMGCWALLDQDKHCTELVNSNTRGFRVGQGVEEEFVSDDDNDGKERWR